MEATKTIDVCGRVCPYPVMEVKIALKDMENEEILGVITDYEPAAKESIPNFCQKKGYLCEIVEKGGGMFELFVKKI